MMDLLKDLMVMLRGMWKYKWLMLSCAWIIGLLGWLVVFAMPSKYEATAQVYLDTSSRLRDVVRSLGMEPNVESRVFLVRQALVGRPQLEAVARSTDLDLRATTEEEMERLIAGLQESISLRSGRTKEAANLFNLAYADNDRDTAIAVVDALLNNFVENVLRKKDSDTLRATDFLDEQLAYYRKLLNDTESALEAFKRTNPSYVLNEEGQGYFERLQTEETELERLRRELRVEQDKRNELRRQLTGADPYVPEASGSAGSSSVAIPGNDTSNRIKSLESQRRDKLLAYTDQHPDVVALDEQIMQLREQLKAELAALSGGADGATAANNPLYIEVQLQLSNSNLKIAALSSEIGQIQSKINELNSSIDTAPELDRQHTELVRDYDKYLSLYNEVKLSAERERIGRVGEQQDVVTFNIIDPPAASIKPVSPNRTILLLGVLVVALGAGAGLGFIAYQVKPSFSDTATLQEVTGINVIGSVSYTFPDAKRFTQRMDVTGFGIALGVLVLVFLGSIAMVDRVTPLVHGVLYAAA